MSFCRGGEVHLPMEPIIGMQGTSWLRSLRLGQVPDDVSYNDCPDFYESLCLDTCHTNPNATSTPLLQVGYLNAGSCLMDGETMDDAEDDADQSDNGSEEEPFHELKTRGGRKLVKCPKLS